MSKRYLGEEIDIHAGGEDLIFPHHENEIAQSEAANDKPFAKYWMHNAFPEHRQPQDVQNPWAISSLSGRSPKNTISGTAFLHAVRALQKSAEFQR